MGTHSLIHADLRTEWPLTHSLLHAELLTVVHDTSFSMLHTDIHVLQPGTALRPVLRRVAGTWVPQQMWRRASGTWTQIT